VEYEISLTKVAEPPEERMEQALFSPPLSKQRVEFAVQHILESHATTLVRLTFSTYFLLLVRGPSCEFEVLLHCSLILDVDLEACWKHC